MSTSSFKEIRLVKTYFTMGHALYIHGIDIINDKLRHNTSNFISVFKNLLYRHSCHLQSRSPQQKVEIASVTGHVRQQQPRQKLVRIVAVAQPTAISKTYRSATVVRSFSLCPDSEHRCHTQSLTHHYTLSPRSPILLLP